MTLALPQSREAFAAAQVEMTQGWYDNLVRSKPDLEAYLRQRNDAYLDRWREAARYIGRGGRVLDVGGGHIFARQFAFFKDMDWDYWYADLGPEEVANSRALGASLGFVPENFSQRFNHELDYPPEHFDGVFASHCVEHSMDLKLTLAQINRLLKPGGTFVMSVPFGFDNQINHPYFFTAVEWLTLLEDSGFTIRAHQIGDEYPEIGEDLLIAARKTGAPGPLRLDLARYSKASFTFHDLTSGAFRTAGTRIDKGDHLILDGDWRLDLTPPPGAVEVAPVFQRHDWSGVVSVRAGADEVREDLFRPYPAALPVRLTLSRPAETVSVTPVGRHPASRGTQGVFMGFLAR